MGHLRSTRDDDSCRWGDRGGGAGVQAVVQTEGSLIQQCSSGHANASSSNALNGCWQMTLVAAAAMLFVRAGFPVHAQLQG